MKSQVRSFFNIVACCFLWVLLFPQSGFSDSAGLKTSVAKIKGTGRVLNAIQTSDGKYLSVSRYVFKDSGGFVVTKRHPSGTKIWQTAFKVVDDKFGYSTINAIAETDDGGYLIGGGKWFGEYTGAYGGLIVRLNRSGDVLWKKSPGALYVTSFFTLPGGDFIVAGSNLNPFFWSYAEVARFSSEGDVLWAKTYDTTAGMFGFLSAITKDNHFVFATTRYDNYAPNGVNLLEVNTSGNTVLRQTLKIKGFDLISLAPTSDKGVILLGYGNQLIKVSKSGNIEWTAKYGLENDSEHGVFFPRLAQGADEGYLLTGALFESTGSVVAGILLKIDKVGDVIFTQRFGRKDSQEAGEIVFPTEAGYFILGSSHRNSMLILRVNPQGTVTDCNFFRAFSIHRQPVGTATRVRELSSPQESFDSMYWESLDLTPFEVHEARTVICN